jgi:hypothetical protein
MRFRGVSELDLICHIQHHGVLDHRFVFIVIYKCVRKLARKVDEQECGRKGHSIRPYQLRREFKGRHGQRYM